jgi:hypothetical protein
MPLSALGLELWHPSLLLQVARSFCFLLLTPTWARLVERSVKQRAVAVEGVDA